MQNRDKRLPVLFTEEERKRLDVISHEAGLSAATYARVETIKAMKRDVLEALRDE